MAKRKSKKSIRYPADAGETIESLSDQYGMEGAVSRLKHRSGYKTLTVSAAYGIVSRWKKKMKKKKKKYLAKPASEKSQFKAEAQALYVKGYRPTEILAALQKKFPDATFDMKTINRYLSLRQPKLNGKYEVIINNPDGGEPITFHLSKNKVTKLISNVLGGEL
jgi:hypothetical protein